MNDPPWGDPTDNNEGQLVFKAIAEGPPQIGEHKKTR